MVAVYQLSGKVTITGVTEAKADLEGMKTAGDEASGGMKGMLGNALSFAAGQAIFMAVGQAVNFLGNQIKDSFSLAMQQQQIMAQTAAVIKSTGDASGESAGAIANLANSLSQVTDFAAPTTEQAENLLLTFTNIGKNVFPAATTATQNMATSMHEDLQSAALQVGKALDNPVTGMAALAREGVTFSASQKAAVAAMVATGNTAGAQKVILAELNKEFGGSAVAAGKTFPGQLQILQDKFNDIKETIAASVLPMLGQLMGYLSSNLMPVFSRFSDWFTGTALPAVQQFAGYFTGTVIPGFQNAGSMISKFTGNASAMQPVLIGIGAVLAAAVVPAVWSLAAGVLAASWPAVALGVAVAGLVATFEHFYSTNTGFKAVIDNLINGFKQAASFVQANFIPAMQQVGGFLQANVLPILQTIGSFVASQFIPVWQQLQQLWTGQLLPLFKQLWGAIQPMMPELELLGKVVGGIVVVALGLLVGIISGVVKGFAGLLSGLATAIGGIIQMFTGAVQVISGIVRFLYDLFTGNFGALKSDLGVIWQGIINIFDGAWNTIRGIFQGAWGAISGIVSGFVQGIIGFFTHLWDELVGHSIIPDMINGIVSWFEQLPGRAGAAVQNMISGLMSKMDSLAGLAGNAVKNAVSTILSDLSNAIGGAEQAGANIVKAIAGGLMGAIGSDIGGAMNAIGNFIQAHLPHSPAKMGPLMNLAESGANISKQIAQGMQAGMPAVQSSLNLMLSPSTASSFVPTQQAANGDGRPVILVLDGRALATGLLPYQVSAIRLATGVKF